MGFLDKLFGNTSGLSGSGTKFSDGSGNLYNNAADANKMQSDFSMEDILVPANKTTDTGGGLMDWMGTDSAKNAIGLGGLAFTGFGAVNNYKAGQQAKKQWEAENARANEIMAMNREKYATYKADRDRLNSGYSSGGLAGSGVANG